MKGTEHFKETIERYLDGWAQADELFTVSIPLWAKSKGFKKREKAEVSHKTRKSRNGQAYKKNRLKKS